MIKKFPSSKYLITPIANEATYLQFCEWTEEISDMELDDPKEADKQFEHLDALTTLIEAYEMKNFEFNKIQLTITEVIEQAMEQLNMNKKDLAKTVGFQSRI
jgi:antitoxin component HigA of HigAB toxin-antitoxin module